MTLVLTNVRKKIGEVLIIDETSIRLSEGHVTSLIAPSGAGKTTLLRLIAGLDNPTSGSIQLDEEEIRRPNSKIGLLFQNPTVFPWLTVRENILFGRTLEANSENKDSSHNEIDANNIVDELSLHGLLEHYPGQLSGGQVQRVELARSLMLKQPLLLCDEPFNSLDEKIRQESRDLLLAVVHRHSKTVLFVTHQTDEAIYMSSEILIASGPPLKIKKRLDINVEQPRNSKMLESKQFFDLAAEIRLIKNETGQ